MPTVTVAVIGSGIGAASTCYFLNKLYDGNVQIDVFESANHVGGRSESIKVNGISMELGAGIAYSGNKYISDWTNEFGLVKRKPVDNIFGIWDGEHFVFKKVESSTLTAAKMVARYGTDLYTLRTSVHKLLEKFNGIYPSQEAGKCFETPADLWESVGLLEATQLHFDAVVGKMLSPSSLLQKELMFAVNRVNYNQNASMNYLAGMVSMCPVVTGDVFSLASGWTSIHQAIYRARGVRALYLSHRVSAVHSEEYCRNESSTMLSTHPSTISDTPQMYTKYVVEANGRSMGGYDAVVLTAPLGPVNDIKCVLDGKEVDTSRYRKPFKVTHTTFIKGRLNSDHFAEKSSNSTTVCPSPVSSLDAVLGAVFGEAYNNSSVLPSTVYLTESGIAKEKISSCARYFDYDNDHDDDEDGTAGAKKTHSLYKVFSSDPLSLTTLAKLFSPDSSVVATKKWYAYPQFSPPEDVSVPFRLKANHRVYNTSILEHSVSAMEVSAISGRNIALLVHKDIGNA